MRTCEPWSRFIGAIAVAWVWALVLGCGPVAPAVDPDRGGDGETRPRPLDLGGPIEVDAQRGQGTGEAPNEAKEDWAALPWPPPEQELGERPKPIQPANPVDDPSPKEHSPIDPPPPKPLPGCPAAAAGAKACPKYGQTCRYGTTTCSCTHICSGADMPGRNANVWACQTRHKACPDRVPKEGERCKKRGLRCGYGTCGGATATCLKGKWQVLEYDPPA
jgi:hypothetical protein